MLRRSKHLPVDEQPFPHHVFLSLRFSKIDQFGKGCTLVLARSNSLICPLEALMSYPWSRGNKQGPLFFDENFSPLTKSKFFNKLKILLKVAGFDGNPTLHSFRVGAATTAAALGFSRVFVESFRMFTYNVYIKLPFQCLASA